VDSRSPPTSLPRWPEEERPTGRIMTMRYRARLVLAGLVVSTLHSGAALADTMTVAGRELPVVTAEPGQDGLFVVRGRAALAGRYRRSLLAAQPDRWEREYLAQQGPARPRGARARLARGLPAQLVRVHRDPAGRLFLYRPCDGQHHRRYLIAGDELTVLGGEPSIEIITEARRTSDGHVLVTDRGVRTFRRHSTAGLFEETDERGESWGLLMTPERARKLDLVVNLCRREKRLELSFRPGAAAR
jgi:hypothetical protein